MTLYIVIMFEWDSLTCTCCNCGKKVDSNMPNTLYIIIDRNKIKYKEIDIYMLSAV